MNEYTKERNEKGFTLIELLIAIVVVGILAAVAIVGIGGLTGTANGASCKATADSAKTASAAYYAAHNNTWPTGFDQLASGGANAVFDQGSLSINGAGDTISNGSAWDLKGTFTATAPPTIDPNASGNCGNP
jgi:prepilin-type N-terminal cleavage/methylation domain-containing protein